ncbi:hypothetical protein ACH437_29945 [Streptomyces xinghaiensis]|uniref:hypothetical protein n=1 Tax=Streptomyces xinghaiensis TaxID=1038928 RepID=UPI00379ADEB4
MTGPLRRLLSIDATPSLAPEGPLASEAPWITGIERQGRALGNAGREGRLSVGTRGVLARHVPFHWDRLGFSFRRQAIWARAARESILGS